MAAALVGVTRLEGEGFPAGWPYAPAWVRQALVDQQMN
jgi:hypothetical protein